MKINSKETGVYIIRNTATGLIYIGSTRATFHARCSAHRNYLKRGDHCNSRLQRSWNKYGEGAFAFEILEVVKGDVEVLEREQFWIDHYLSLGEIANVWKVVMAPIGVRHTKETMKSCITELQKERITTLYASGLSSTKIAEEVGCSAQTCLKNLRKVGIPIRDRTLSHPKKEIPHEQEMVQDYMNGDSSLKVAVRYGTTTHLCLKALKRAGISPRPRKSLASLAPTIKKEYLEGTPINRLAEKYECSRAGIVGIVRPEQRSGRRTGERKKPGPKVPTSTVACSQCGALLRRNPAKIKAQPRHFCNKDCFYEYGCKKHSVKWY